MKLVGFSAALIYAVLGVGRCVGASPTFFLLFKVVIVIKQ